MINFHPYRGPLPPHLIKSALSVGVTYGTINDLTCHTYPAIMGIVPISYLSNEAYFWMILNAEPPMSVLKEAKRRLPSLVREWGYSLTAFADRDNEKTNRFLRFFDFEMVYEDEAFKYYKGANYGH